MAKKQQPDPNEILHLQVKPGKTVRYTNILYGAKGTLQVPRRDLDRVEGAYEVIDPARLPDVGERD